DRNRSHWSTSKTPSYTKSVSWQHHPVVKQKLISLTLTTAAQLANFTDAELTLAGRFYCVRVDIRFCIQ
ncbi:hypothetical protein P4I14_17695, partial [Escherichia coli]|uniref:hypothetical protein n=1 Tax=Escherichia coli TaxID=562 RepID=UPI003CE76D7D